jgi:hypothetical protein
MFDEEFGIRIGPLGFGWSGGRSVRYMQTETSHVLRISIDPDVGKDEIKARLVKPGVLEIEWPRAKGEEIPVK